VYIKSLLRTVLCTDDTFGEQIDVIKSFLCSAHNFCVDNLNRSNEQHITHRRLSPVTLLRYAALCTVGQFARKIS